jgi:hypothetical protein
MKIRRRRIMNKRRQLLLASLAGTASSIFAAESGVADSEILLGQSAVLSGPLGPAMQGFSAGAKLAFDDANDKGGIAGRRVRLISLDDWRPAIVSRHSRRQGVHASRRLRTASPVRTRPASRRSATSQR